MQFFHQTLNKIDCEFDTEESVTDVTILEYSAEYSVNTKFLIEIIRQDSGKPLSVGCE